MGVHQNDASLRLFSFYIESTIETLVRILRSSDYLVTSVTVLTVGKRPSSESQYIVSAAYCSGLGTDRDCEKPGRHLRQKDVI